MSVHWRVLKALMRNPLGVAVVDDTRSYKRLEILVAALNLADVLREKCDSKTVGIMLPSSGAFPIAALAGWIAGKTLVPLNFLLKQDELQYVIDDCECDTIITASAMLEYLGYTPKLPERKRMHGQSSILLLDKLNLKRVPLPAIPAMPEDEELAVLLYTSGTSGKPKGVMLSHGNISANIDQVRGWIDLTPQMTFLGVLPQFHSFGLTALTMVPLICGCKVVYSARFVPQKIVRLIREHKANVMIAIPSMYNALLHVKEGGAEDVASLMFTVSGGEPLPDAVVKGFRERYGKIIAEGYGLTETSPVTNWCRPFEYRPHSVGRPLPKVKQRIVDIDTGRDLGPNQDGEVRIAGPNLMQGYFKLPKESAAALDEQGYLRTGDIGRFDDDGHLYITGRLKDMLIVGGENIFPREIEEVLNHHPSIKESGVVGRRDEMRGEVPVAFVEIKEGAHFEEREVLSYLRGKLAGYKVPAEIRVVTELPRGPTGKVLRRALRLQV
jgi:long-chain acyl-CoA synthetase